MRPPLILSAFSDLKVQSVAFFYLKVKSVASQCEHGEGFMVKGEDDVRWKMEDVLAFSLFFSIKSIIFCQNICASHLFLLYLQQNSYILTQNY